jgi:glucokinase
MALGLISPDNVIVARERLPTHASAGPEQAIARCAEAVRALTGHAPEGARISVVGVCSPGPVDHTTGMILDPPNLTGWRDVPFRDALAAQTGLPVRLEHDAKAAALGEYMHGAARAARENGLRDMVYVIVGTGMGCAILLNGALHRGRTNAAGELGHITINRDGDPCSCGRRGCAEAYTAGPAIERRYRLYSGATQTIDSASVVERAVTGDVAAQRALDDAGAALGAAIATVAMIVDVELFVIGGSVARAGERLLAPARAALRHHAFASVAPRIQIVQCALFEDGAILGAAEVLRVES